MEHTYTLASVPRLNGAIEWRFFNRSFVSRTMAAVSDVCAGLLRHKHLLLRELCDTNILDVLVKKGIFSLNDFELITGAADSDKCNYFIEIVSKQSGVKLNDLCVVLSKECPKLNKELLNDRHRFIVNGKLFFISPKLKQQTLKLMYLFTYIV